MKNIVIVSWYYYPASAVGARRVFNFKKYLERFGHHVTVVTANKQYYDKIDPQLDDPQAAAHIERTRARFYLRVPPRKKGERVWEGFVRRSRYILSRELGKVTFPDPYSGWIGPALQRAEALHRKRAFDTVISSGPPWSSFVIGDKIASKFGLPHLMDYRDPWTAREHGFAYEHSSIWSKRFRPRSESLEREMIHRASVIIVNTNDTRRLFTQKFGDDVESKIVLVRNGFDPEVHALIKQQSLAAASRDADDKFSLVHTGTYYGSRRLGTLIEAVNHLMQHGEITSANFEVLSFGALHAEDRRLLERYHLEPLFSERDFVTYEASLMALTRSSMNLLVIGPEHGAMIPAKLYDYLMVEKPIFAIGPINSEAKQIIEGHKYGLYADIADPPDIADKLRQGMRMSAYGGGALTLSAPGEFNIRDQVQKLSKLIGG